MIAGRFDKHVAGRGVKEITGTGVKIRTRYHTGAAKREDPAGQSKNFFVVVTQSY